MSLLYTCSGVTSYFMSLSPPTRELRPLPQDREQSFMPLCPLYLESDGWTR